MEVLLCLSFNFFHYDWLTDDDVKYQDFTELFMHRTP